MRAGWLPVPTETMVIRSGRRGKFLGCSGYPKCKNTAEVPAKLMEEMGLNGEAKNESPPLESVDHEAA